MSSAHLTAADLDRLRTGHLPAGDVLAVSEHLAGCATCRQMSSGDDAARFLSAATGLTDHPDPDSQLFPYVDGRLDRGSRQEVEAHLAICELCREDVADLRAVAPRRRRSRVPVAVAAAAAAAVLAVAVIAALLVSRRPPQVVEQRPDRWHAMLQSARAAGHLPKPAVLAMLHRRGESLRGADSRSAALRAPVGVVVESVRPQFSWSATAGARLRVSVFDGERLVAQSPYVFEKTWDCDRDLTRGIVYSWHVEARHDHTLTVTPGAGEGDALFRVLDESAARDVAEARRRHPGDHLLAGVLYAHYGVRGRAEEELELATVNPAQAADARRFLDSIRNWS